MTRYPGRLKFAVAGALLLALLALPTHARAVALGEAAPDFALKDLSGSEVSLKSLSGRVVFLNFWASWCAPCRKEMPLLNELSKRRKEVSVVAINIDKKKANAEEFLKKVPVEFRVLLDPEGRVVSSYNALAMPMSFVIDPAGKVRFLHFGFNEAKDPAAWEKEIDEITGGAKR